MKKLISMMITVMLLLPCLGITAFAANSDITISDDYQKLYVEGNTYSRCNTSMLETEIVDYMYKEVTLSDDQKKTVKEVSLEANEHQTLIRASISFQDGATLSVDFLQDEYAQILANIMGGKATEYTVDFEWPNGNVITAKSAQLFGEKTTLSEKDLAYCDYFKVTSQSEDGKLVATTGSMITVDDSYYYVNFAECDVTAYYDFDPYSLNHLDVYTISDESLIAELKSAEESYYADDLGFLYNDDFTEKVSAVFLIFAFAFIPLVIFVVFLFMAFRSKTIYRKLFTLICSLSAVELVVFVIIAVMGSVLR